MTEPGIRLAIEGALAVLISVLAGPAANAAVVERHLISEGMVAISITGEIIDGDAEVVSAAMKGATKAGYSVAEVRLNSIGGSLFEGANIVRRIRAANLTTSIGPGATCASICFLAFAAGSKKLVDPAARIGVHVASAAGKETPASIAATAAMARIARRLDVPAEIIEDMVSTPASQIFWLGRSDLVAMGAAITNRRKLGNRKPAARWKQKIAGSSAAVKSRSRDKEFANKTSLLR